jgi:cell division GTPase FtsZ
MKMILLVASLTGLFCVGFAFVVSEVVRQFGALPIAVVSFTSGFLGSLCAQTVVRPWQARLRRRTELDG